MTKLEMMVIRACKLNDTHTRLKSIYRRFYNSDGDEKFIRALFTSQLAEICEKYNLITVSKLIDMLAPSNEWKYTPSNEWKYISREDVANPEFPWLHAPEKTRDFRYEVLISIVHLSSVDKFPNLISPIRFRR